MNIYGLPKGQHLDLDHRNDMALARGLGRIISGGPGPGPGPRAVHNPS